MKKLLPVIFFSSVLLSCSDNTQPSPAPLVVEGWIEDGRPPVVMLHKAIDLSSESGSVYDYLQDNMLLFGKVRLSDGDTAVTLTEQFDPSYLIPLRYSTAYIFGHTGKTYSIEVECEGQQVRARTTVPHPVPIDSIVIECTDDDYVNILTYWTDNPATEDYYNLYYRPVGEAEFLACRFGVRSDESARENVMSAAVLRRNNFIDTSDRSILFKRNDTLTVKLAHIDKDSYDFWLSFRNLGMSNNHANNTLHSNIEGGRGYWCGMGSSEHILVLQNDTVLRFE